MEGNGNQRFLLTSAPLTVDAGAHAATERPPHRSALSFPRGRILLVGGGDCYTGDPSAATARPVTAAHWDSTETSTWTATSETVSSSPTSSSASANATDGPSPLRVPGAAGTIAQARAHDVPAAPLFTSPTRTANAASTPPPQEPFSAILSPVAVAREVNDGGHTTNRGIGEERATSEKNRPEEKRSSPYDPKTPCLSHQYGVAPLAYPPAWTRAEADVAVKLPEADEALNLEVLSAALKAYEDRQSALLHPSLSDHITPTGGRQERPQRGRREQHDEKAAARKRGGGVFADSGLQTKSRRQNSLPVHSTSDSSSCGCASSCTCRQQQPTSPPHAADSSRDDSLSSCCSCASCVAGLRQDEQGGRRGGNICSSCSACGSSSFLSSSSSSFATCDGCNNESCLSHHRRRQQRQQQQCGSRQKEEVFRAGNILAAPQLLFLPAFSEMKQRQLQTGVAVGGSGEQATSAIPPFPLSGPESFQEAGAGARQTWLQQERSRETEERQAHQQFLEDALTAMGVTLRKSGEQLTAIQLASEQREAALTEKLQLAEQKLAEKSNALATFHEQEADKVRLLKEQWMAERRRSQTQRTTSPVLSFSSLAQEEYNRQRDGRSVICSKGTMTCCNLAELPNNGDKSGHADGMPAKNAKTDAASRGTLEGEGGEEAASDAAQLQQLQALHVAQQLHNHRCFLMAEEERARRQLADSDEEARALLQLLFTSLPQTAAAAQTRRVVEAKEDEWVSRHRAEQLRRQIEVDILHAEEIDRLAIAEEEERGYLRDVLLVCQRGCTSLSVAQLMETASRQENEIAQLSHSVKTLESERTEALQRERDLRLQLLHALRMPTTTILQRPSYFDLLKDDAAGATAHQTTRLAERYSVRPREEGGTAADGDDEEETDERRATEETCLSNQRHALLTRAQQQRLWAEAELPVHRRFARAHQEAVKAVRAQHREV